VDDDRALLETTAAMLEEEFDVRTASSAAVALEMLDGAASCIVCADFDMPDMDGIALLRRVHELHPETRGILITGLRDRLPQGLAREESIFAVVYKPYTAEALFQCIREAYRLIVMTHAVGSFGRSSKKLGKK
jgi:DNA-binding NtrC family response regulator